MSRSKRLGRLYRFAELLGGLAILSIWLLVFLSAYSQSSLYTFRSLGCETTNFKNEIYDDSTVNFDLNSTSSRTTTRRLLLIFNAILSFLNVSSHLAVVLGCLDDTYVLSILVGVGFDICSSFVYVAFWISNYTFSYYYSDTSSNFDQYAQPNIEVYDGQKDAQQRWLVGRGQNWNGDVVFCATYVSFFFYHLTIHTGALYNIQSRSLRRTSDTVCSAWNNIQGVPGICWKDHFFAFTDLGTHTFQFIVSLVLLWKCKNIQESSSTPALREFLGEEEHGESSARFLPTSSERQSFLSVSELKIIFTLLCASLCFTVLQKRSAALLYRRNYHKDEDNEKEGSEGNYKKSSRLYKCEARWTTRNTNYEQYPMSSSQTQSSGSTSTRTLGNNEVLSLQLQPSAGQNDLLQCNCNVCNNRTAFGVDIRNGQFCALWFNTFSQLHTKLEELRRQQQQRSGESR